MRKMDHLIPVVNKKDAKMLEKRIAKMPGVDIVASDGHQIYVVASGRAVYDSHLLVYKDSDIFRSLDEIQEWAILNGWKMKRRSGKACKGHGIEDIVRSVVNPQNLDFGYWFGLGDVGWAFYPVGYPRCNYPEKEDPKWRYTNERKEGTKKASGHVELDEDGNEMLNPSSMYPSKLK